MKFLSVCSGIEAASVAWSPLGWRAWAFSEIEAFPAAVLKHHYPDVPNLGDMTQFKTWPTPHEPIDILCGGTPCQSFSVAGLRKGLDDPRGDLMLTFLAIAALHRPRWVVWENVPGVLSSNGGRDFGSFLGGLAVLGYGFAYRVLDAQFFGVAQRRRRVFVVGHLGDWHPAAAVLFERHSLSGHPAPSRKARQGSSANTQAGTRSGVDLQNASVNDEFVGTLDAEGLSRGNRWHGVLASAGACVGALTARFGGNAMGAPEVDGGFYLPVIRHDDSAIEAKVRPSVAAAAHAFDARQSDVIQYGDKTGPLDTDGHSTGVLYANYSHDYSQDWITDPSGVNPALTALAHASGNLNVAAPFEENFDSIRETQIAPAMTTQGYRVSQNAGGLGLRKGLQVRRLTPVECERLQGFPDGYTSIPWRGKPASECPDGPRYKALGNSWAVPVARWIGRRIAMVDDLLLQAHNQEVEHA